MAPLRLHIQGRVFRDAKNREVTLRGINCAGDAKYPANPDLPSHVKEGFFEADSCSFVGRPFTVEDAHTHFSRLKRFGYNTIRYIFTWEAIEHAGPGKYDEEWIKHTIEVLRLAKEYGFYIFMDPHQDVWSRFCGGSGAPMWTLYAAGLNPQAFQRTEAALVQNSWPDPAQFPKMIWATNYTRLACQVLFTMFFAGRDFVPKAIINGENIQDYLQGHFIGACRHLALRIREAGDIENDVVIGWESMNEPNKGLIGVEDISSIPSAQKLQKGTSPTAWQAILTGSGRPCEIDTWDVGSMGPYKTGTQLVDPKGEQAWLPSDYDDSKYGFKRDPGWKLGECIWAQHGIWDPANDEVLRKNYFSKHPKTGKKVDEEYFINECWMEYYRRHRDAIKEIHTDAIMFCQPSPFEIPPSIKGTKDDTSDMVYAPHYYDGLTLMTKKWNRYWSVDIFGILRGRYSSPAFAIKIGETAIRNCLRDQLSAMKQEGIDYMGEHPCLFSEIGIPYDMDEKAAYKTGDYTSQTLAMDANHFALEGCGANGFALWTYTGYNNHQWGDLWNGEDLSIYSVDDKPLPLSPFPQNSQAKTPSASTTSLVSKSNITPSNLQRTLTTPTITPTASVTGPDIATSGFRAAEAYVRPSPIYTTGELKSYGFDLRNCVFTSKLIASSVPSEDSPTEYFLPEFHFPRESVKVETSSGKWTIAIDDADGGLGLVQRLRWWHGMGEQSITVTGVKRRIGVSVGKEEEEEGYLEQCRQSACLTM